MKGFIHGFRHYIDFAGRDSRSLFWGFIIGTHLVFLLLLIPLLVFLVRFVLGMQHALLLPDGPKTCPAELAELVRGCSQQGGVTALLCLCAALGWLLVILLPTVAATVRRLRDAGQSPWWVLPPVLSCLPIASFLGLWPLLFSLVTLVLTCLPTRPAIPPHAGPGEPPQPDDQLPPL